MNATYERLTALDSSFLVLEGPRTPMHVAALLTMERAPFADENGRIRIGALRQFVESRLHLTPKLRQVLREVPFGLGRPVWVDDHDFDLSHHVRLLELPAPGGQAALDEVVDELLMTLLDRSRPLWEWWVIDGLDGDRIALLEKMHHALIDGVSGVQLLGTLTDLGALAPGPDGPWVPRPVPSDVQLVADALAEQVREPWAVTSALGGLVRTGREGVRQLRDVAATLATAARPTDTSAAVVSLNQKVSRRRHLRSLELPLPETKRIAHAHDTKVNDVMLTVVSGGLRALLQSRGQPVRDHTLHALVPENVRAADEHLALGNRVSGFFAPLPVHEADATRSLECIRESMRHKRDSREDVTAGQLLAGADHLPYGLLRPLAPVVHGQPWVNTVVTNMVGPREELTLMGSRVLSIVPVVPLGGNLTLGVAVLSYRDTLCIAVNACADSCPDVDVLLAGMRGTFEALLSGLPADSSVH